MRGDRAVAGWLYDSAHPGACACCWAGAAQSLSASAPVHWPSLALNLALPPNLSAAVRAVRAEIGQNVEAKFRTLAKGIMFYEKRWFSGWSESINGVAMQHLKQPIFRRNTTANRVEVNFHCDLIELIRETRYLDRMGFPIPEIALNVALQEVKYHQWLEGLDLMLQHYYDVIAQLLPIERELMKRKLDELEQSLQPGFTILNWNSLGIPEFITACNKAINTFQQVVKQVQKNSGIIEQVVYAIAGSQVRGWGAELRPRWGACLMGHLGSRVPACCSRSQCCFTCCILHHRLPQHHVVS
jgi:hypothetical protein